MSFLRKLLSGKSVRCPVNGGNWIASRWLVRYAIITARFQDNPCLEGFSSEPDEMPPIEAWWSTIIAGLLPPR